MELKIVALDGKDAGKAPLSTQLAAGQHIVVATASGHEPRAQAFANEGDVPVTSLRVDLAADRAAAALADGASIGLSADVSRALIEATLRYADLDAIVLVAATQRRGGPALLVQRCAGTPAECTALVEIGYADRSGVGAAAREAWQATRSATLRYPPTVLVDAGSAPALADDRCKVCRSPILWGSLGAAAVIGTIVVVALVSGSRPPPTVTVDPGQFYLKSACSGFVSPAPRSTENVCLRGGDSAGNTISTV
jgi:hypothetical protein